MVLTRANLALCAVALVWLAAWLAVSHAPAAGEGAIAIAAAFDFSVTASLAMYLLAVRPGHLPRWTLGATIAIGLVFAKLALATTSATRAVMAAGASLELAAVGWLAIRGRSAHRAWRLARAAGAEVGEALEAAFVAARLPARVAAILATELALWPLLATGWRRPAGGAFTVHRNAGWPLYTGVLVFLVLVETAAMHVVLATYGHGTLAWVATALSIYTALWFIADVLALRHGGAIAGEHALELRIGVRWRGTIPWHAIAAVGAPTADAVDLSILGANVGLVLGAPCELRGLLGRRRTAHAIALSIDDREAFVTRVAAAVARAGTPARPSDTDRADRPASP